MTTIIIRMINNSATHATTDTVAIVRAEQKFNIIAQKHIFSKVSFFFFFIIGLLFLNNKPYTNESQLYM